MAETRPRFITPEGFARIRSEYDELFGSERPKLVETISWAAANGDRSENGDYIYGRKRVRFGATVELADEDDNRRTLTIVGDDEADASSARIGWSAPLARALVGARVGDERTVRLPAGEKSYEVIEIRYPG